MKTKPILVHFSEEELDLVDRAAEKDSRKRSPLIRMAALEISKKILGED